MHNLNGHWPELALNEESGPKCEKFAQDEA
jgi:hypothetical protein